MSQAAGSPSTTTKALTHGTNLQRADSPEPKLDVALDNEPTRLGASSSPQLGVGYMQGRHYTEWTDAVKDLKRLGHLDQALDLLGLLCDAAEAECDQARQTLPPWYYEQATIVQRKL